MSKPTRRARAGRLPFPPSAPRDVTIPLLTAQELAGYLAAHPGEVPTIVSRQEWDIWLAGFLGWSQTKDDTAINRVAQMIQGTIVLDTTASAAPDRKPRLDCTQRRFWTMEEAAQQANVSVRTIYTWIQAGQLEHFKLGSIVRIPADALDRLLQRKECYA